MPLSLLKVNHKRYLQTGYFNDHKKKNSNYQRIKNICNFIKKTLVLIYSAFIGDICRVSEQCELKFCKKNESMVDKYHMIDRIFLDKWFEDYFLLSTFIFVKILVTSLTLFSSFYFLIDKSFRKIHRIDGRKRRSQEHFSSTKMNTSVSMCNFLY